MFQGTLVNYFSENLNVNIYVVLHYTSVFLLKISDNSWEAFEVFHNFWFYMVTIKEVIECSEGVFLSGFIIYASFGTCHLS